MRPAFRDAVKTRFIRAAHCRQNRHAGAAIAALGQKFCNLCRGLRAGGEDEEALVGLYECDHLLDGAAVDGQGFNVWQRPTHAGGGELEGGELRVVDDLRWINRATDASPDGEPERIARGEHGDAAATEGFKLFYQFVKRTGPRQALSRYAGRKRVMTVPADNDFGGFEHRAGGRRKAFQTVLSDADNMQPRVRHGAPPTCLQVQRNGSNRGMHK